MDINQSSGRMLAAVYRWLVAQSNENLGAPWNFKEIGACLNPPLASEELDSVVAYLNREGYVCDFPTRVVYGSKAALTVKGAAAAARWANVEAKEIAPTASRKQQPKPSLPTLPKPLEIEPLKMKPLEI